METTINVLDYLSESEISEIAKDEVRNVIRGYLGDEENTKRVLSNLTYQIVFDEVDKHIGENSRNKIAQLTENQIKKDSFNYMVFRNKSYGSSASLGYQIMEQAVKDNKELIQQKVKEAIINKDYQEDVWNKFEELSDNFMSNIYEIVELARNSKKENANNKGNT